ncbi:hypothetical protein Q3G72_030485 [Acer saccharum]|nr:hypothetical protein Q3G72_030485 [Acer saccharum]
MKDRIAHPSNNVSPVVWKQMVDKWMGAKWQDKSKKNANNQSCVQMHHATGSVSFAKYKYEQVKQTGVEPSPIDCFKKFNMSKTKDGEAKWSSERAKVLHNSDGKQWPVRCLHRRHRATFGQGWRGFILDNNLGEGDVCVFEVLRSRDIVLQVTEFHVLESAEFVNRPPFGSAR